MKRSRRKEDLSIDWTQVRERLAHTQAAAAPEDLTPERARAVMNERAHRLARAPAPPAGDQLQLLTFALGLERYGIETTYVREVVRVVDVTPVPGAPEFVLGVTNLRGEIVCVVDLRRFFSVPQAALTDLSRIILVGTHAAELSFLADRAFEVTHLPISEVLAVPDSVTGVGREYVRGITRDAVILFDGAVLLRDPRLFVDLKDAGTA